MNIRYLTKASLIAATYIVLVIVQVFIFPSWFAYGEIQLRIAEGLALLPLVEAAAIPGVFIGCLISNLLLGFSGFGLVDIIGGSLVSLLAAYLTSKAKNKWLAILPPVLLNGLVVSIWVSYFTKIPYIFTMLSISLGELLALLIFGNLFLYAYDKAMNIKNY